VIKRGDFVIKTDDYGIKKGIRTSEFWIVTLSNLFTALTAMGIRLPDQDSVTAMICAIITNVVALLYAWLRTHIKTTTLPTSTPVSLPLEDVPTI
jgi:hypothetical protein